MRVKIANTSKINDLDLHDENGISMIEDVIAPDIACGLITYDDETDVYETDQDTYDAWDKWIDDYTDAQDALNDLMDDLSADPERSSRDLDDIRYRILCEAGGYDTMDQPAYLLKAVSDYRNDVVNADDDN